MDRNRPVELSRFTLCVIAFLIGITVVATEALLAGYLDYIFSSLQDEWLPTLVRVLLVSAPFLMLAIRGITAPTPWAVGFVLTVLVWTYVVSIQWNPEGTSVSTSMGVAVIAFGSSVVITAICALMSDHIRRHSSNITDL